MNYRAGRLEETPPESREAFATGLSVCLNTVTSTTTGSNCPPGGTDTRCAATVTVVNATTLTFTKTADVASTTAGGVVHYTVTAANSGLSVYTGATFTDNLTGVLDDATYNIPDRVNLPALFAGDLNPLSDHDGRAGSPSRRCGRRSR